MYQRRNRIPNFLIVGAAKCGTSSIAQYIEQHPQAFIPKVKEPMFFSSSFYQRKVSGDPLYTEAQKKLLVRTWEEYRSLFRDVKKEKAVGEASTPYLYLYQETIPKIKEYLKDPKIIIMLRNPADRAFSAYSHILRDTGWNMSFDRCIRLEKERIEAGWDTIHHILRAGFYYRQVKAYLEAFSHVRIFLFDDLYRDAAGLMKEVYRFLGIDEHFSPDLEVRWNISGVPSNRLLYRFLFGSWIMRWLAKPFLGAFFDDSKLQRWKECWRARILKKPVFTEEKRRELLGIFREDIIKLQALIGRDLSFWIQI
ncbi:MAG: sulfotransferase [Candidatus Aminicenantes bacterium]|nr:sulfotransferase [Candidatus Aminicenantes bacterium]